MLGEIVNDQALARDRHHAIVAARRALHRSSAAREGRLSVGAAGGDKRLPASVPGLEVPLRDQRINNLQGNAFWPHSRNAGYTLRDLNPFSSWVVDRDGLRPRKHRARRLKTIFDDAELGNVITRMALRPTRGQTRVAARWTPGSGLAVWFVPR